MKKFNFTNILLLTSMSFSAQLFAGEAELSWADPSLYTDIKPSIATSKATLANVQKAFTETFQSSAAGLPEGYIFKAEITDVDLAGRVNPPQAVNPNMINTRALTNNYFPSITLNYTLSDAKDEVLLTGHSVIVKDMDYLSGSNATSNTTAYYYETRMIKHWFARTITSVVK